MNKRQKQIAIIAAAGLTLLLIYRWYQNRTSTAATGATAGTAAPDTSASDYAALAGQQQSDAAALQGQNTQLASQEQSDVAALNAALLGQGAQEQSDAANLQGLISGLGAQLAALPVAGPVVAAVTPGHPHAKPPAHHTPAHASGHKQVDRHKVPRKNAHAPKPIRVRTQPRSSHDTPPVPRRVTLEPPSSHPMIAHPNPAHAQRANVTTPARPRLPQPAKPEPRPVTRKSGRRK